MVEEIAARVGLGSVCRRQATVEISCLVHELVLGQELDNLHGFGMKIEGLAGVGYLLRSADSRAAKSS